MTWPEHWLPPPPSFLERLRGHHQTIAPFLERKWRAPEAPATEFWETTLSDETVGEVRLSGRLHRADPKHLVILVHGLGGNEASGYMQAGLAAIARLGASCLLLNVRGADRGGQDISHAGLTDDLAAAFAAPSLAGYSVIDLIGYSLGGHLTFSYAAERPDARLRAVAALGSPLDLSASATAFDAAEFGVYRRHVMSSLHEIYTAAYQRRPVGLVPELARKIQKIREWDARIVAPRFGFQSAEDYYEAVSAGPKLSALSVPALYVGAPADPMVPLRAVTSAAYSERLSVHWCRGAGHLGFPKDFDLKMNAPLGLEPQVLGWMARSNAAP